MEITITEALAELKTIKARIAKKREGIGRYFARDSRMVDPIKEPGGSAAFVLSELDSIRDLEERYVNIRSSIQECNLATNLTVNGQERTVGEWLNWRHDLANDRKTFYDKLARGLQTVREKAGREGMTITSPEKAVVGASEIVCAMSEVELTKVVDDLEKTLGELDGKLSLVNATTKISV